MPDRQYSQLKAMLAITKASLIAQFRSPSALVFGFLFPLFFILIFGIGGGGIPGVTIALDKNSDTANKVYYGIKQVPNINIRQYDNTEEGNAKKLDDLLKGRITAILNIQPAKSDSSTKYEIEINSSKASQERVGLLQVMLNGVALAKVIFQFVILSIIILIGKFAFGFTLIHGFTTFLEMMFISFIGLFVFMGFGFVISGVSKNINAVPAITNAIGFPQFMLSGTFFPYESLPKFLHPIAKALPLTHLNDALRKISFEGLHLSDCWKQLGILGIWGVVVYIIAIKVFRWE